MKKTYLILIAFGFILSCKTLFSETTSPITAYTTVAPERKIYSEYTPNKNSKFKGTIIFDAGGGDNTEIWKEGTKGKETILDCVNQYASIFTYDRPGLGKSTPDYSLTLKNPITVKKVSGDLWKVLNERKIPKPYIIVSHSQGGLYAQYLIRKYPKDFAGAIFLDTLGAENISIPFNQKAEVDKYVKEAETHDAKYMYDQYSPTMATQATEKHIIADAAYVVPGLDMDIAQIKAYPKMPNIPIVVLYSTYMKQTMPNWVKGESEIAHQSDKGKVIEVSGGHYIYQEKPELVCQYVKEVMNQADTTK